MRSVCFALLLVPAVALPDVEYRIHPDFTARMRSVRTVGIADPVVKLFELTAGNSRVFQPEWSDRARDNVAGALESSLRVRGLAVKRLDGTVGKPEELRDVTLLYEAVADAIVQATYANAFPAKVSRFEYSVGDVRELLAAQGVDAIVFAYGVANISSGGRKALQALSGALGGGYSYGIDRIWLAVVDATGAVLWFDVVASSSHDLREPESTVHFVSQLTNDLPAVSR